jgi:plastocyanin
VRVVLSVIPAAVLVLGTLAPRAPNAAFYAPRATVATVELRDDVFDPQVVRIEPGDSVMWVNHGRNPHNVVEADGAFRSKILQIGDTYTIPFPKVGRFGYYCSLHGAPSLGMFGVVLVGVTPENADTTSATRTYPADPPVRPSGGRTIRVPRDQPSIQAGVDAARPGDMVLVAPGTYREAVIVTTPHLVIRGEDRNRVILDGGFDPDLANGIAVFGADGVVIENMTARHYRLNGFYWRSVWGYRGSYLTADANGDYGLYAFDSGVGQFDHSYASGHPDSGFYIGQCDPCNALVTDVIARYNAIGWSGTNASGNMVIRDSEWAYNMAGIAPNTLDVEGLAPEHGQTVVNNWVHDNNNRAAPAKPDFYAFFGTGIIVIGGNDNEIAYNRVADHVNAGIAVAFSISKNLWLAHRNHVHDNVVTGSGIADLTLVAPAGGDNCFAVNGYDSVLPPRLEDLYACGTPLSALGGGDAGIAFGGAARLFSGLVLGSYPHGEPRDAPPAPAQPGMPDIAAAGAVAGPASRIDPASEVRRAAALHGAAAPAAPAFSITNAFYVGLGYAVPIAAVLGALWSIVAVLRRAPVRRRFVLVPLGAYAIFAIAIFLDNVLLR